MGDEGYSVVVVDVETRSTVLIDCRKRRSYFETHRLIVLQKGE